MNRRISMICIILCTLFLSEAHAQRKSVGSSFSYSGIGIVYEQTIDSNSFAELQLKMETTNLYEDRELGAGMSASLSWNMVFADIGTRDGSNVTFYAGPGLALGITGDIDRKSGFMFGLKGKLGAECTFNRNVTLSICLAPVVGLHLGTLNGEWNMVLYRTGLLYAIMPEIGVKYAF